MKSTAEGRTSRLLSYCTPVIWQPRASTKMGFCKMNCMTLAENVQRFQPDATPREVARLCLLLSNAVDEVDALENPECLEETWSEIGLRLQAATDQHAAMTEELEALARSDPRRFTPDQIWILIRAIKVQSQVLRLYVGDPQLAV
jgi:hypothetical protein